MSHEAKQGTQPQFILFKNFLDGMTRICLSKNQRFEVASSTHLACCESGLLMLTFVVCE